jgi:molybdopterin/thiamine biosynthesis adenylyltransferase
MIDPLIVLPDYYAERIVRSVPKSGYVEVKQDMSEQLYVVDGFTLGRDQGRRSGGSEWVEGHYLAHASSELRGVWYEVDPALHYVGIEGRAKSGSLPIQSFKDAIDAPWLALNKDAGALAITYARLDDGTQDWRAWVLSEELDAARLIPIAVVDERPILLRPLFGHWPVGDLAVAHVVVVGAGSIGSAANDALAAYGVGQLTLVDPDRLLTHNFARHRAHPRELGRHKVNAERDRLKDRDRSLQVRALPFDVIYDADVMRPLFAEADAVLVASDGVDSRRAANHLARRAGTPAVFACVLENGAYGEVVRTRPSQGCLACARAELLDDDGIAPERTLDRGYGTGTRHMPMTAVGADLAIVGQIAAKVTVATILEPRGHRDQRLPGDQAIIPLRPKPGLAAPFDLDATLDVRWRALPPSREECFTCRGVAA